MLNADLSSETDPVWLIEAVPVAAGQSWVLRFESADDRWAHGVWLAVDGSLVIGDTSTAQIVLWQQTSPPVVNLTVQATADGLLRLYNVWDSGRGRTRESQSATSGMRREAVDGGWRYRCNDIGLEPDYSALVFTLTRA